MDTEQTAREIVKRVSDAAIELAFVRHGLTSDEVDVDDDTPPKAWAEAHDEYCEQIKEDVLACLTGDDTGCLDPEDLDTTNCELLFVADRIAAALASQVVAEIAEKDAEIERLKQQVCVALATTV